MRVPIAAVDVLSELAQRASSPTRVVDEHRAFTLLAEEMATAPDNLLQKLVELTVGLGGAHTAAVTMREGELCRWAAVAGVFSRARGGTMPRDQSPCAVCIDRNATQLMHLPDLAFPVILAAPRFVEVMLIPFHSQGKPMGAVWLVSHTDDRRFNREDERFVSQLARFASAGWQIRRLTDHLESSRQRNDDVLAMSRHELTNPINAIVTAAALVNLRLGGDEIATTATKMITRQSRHLLRLADDLRDVARIESGRLQLERQRIDARAIVLDSVAGLRPQLDRRGHSLTLELGDTPVLLDADPPRLRQLVSRLVGSVAEYTTANGQISVSLAREPGAVVLEVRDNSVGKPSSYLTAAPRPTFKRGVGSGLALLESLTEMHGGFLVVPGDGADSRNSFSIRLPVAAAEVPPAGEVVLRAKKDRRRADRTAAR